MNIKPDEDYDFNMYFFACLESDGLWTIYRSLMDLNEFDENILMTCAFVSQTSIHPMDPCGNVGGFNIPRMCRLFYNSKHKLEFLYTGRKFFMLKISLCVDIVGLLLSSKFFTFAKDLAAYRIIILNKKDEFFIRFYYSTHYCSDCNKPSNTRVMGGAAERFIGKCCSCLDLPMPIDDKVGSSLLVSAPELDKLIVNKLKET